MAQVKRVIIDADPGIDDTAAILMALASDKLQVEAFTTVHGNASVEQCTVNTLRILEAAGRTDIPVYQGVGRTLTYHIPTYAPHIHGDDGIGNIDAPLPTITVQERHGVPELIDRVLASPGELTVLAIGRQTNVALALSIEPRFAECVREIVVMGRGAVPAGECDSACDCEHRGGPRGSGRGVSLGGTSYAGRAGCVQSCRGFGGTAAARMGCRYARDQNAGVCDTVHKQGVSEG